MSHNTTAAHFRGELIRRGIPVEVVPWDGVIYAFARDNAYMDYEYLIPEINDLIDYTLPRVGSAHVSNT